RRGGRRRHDPRRIGGALARRGPWRRRLVVLPAARRREVDEHGGDGKADDREPQKRSRRPALALDRLVILAAIGGRMSRRHGIVRELRDEFLNRRLGIEADLDGVRSDEGAAEDAARQAGDVVALERLERGDRDLGGVCDLPKRYS